MSLRAARVVLQDNILAVFPPPSHNRLWISFASERERERAKSFLNHFPTFAVHAPIFGRVERTETKKKHKLSFVFQSMPLNADGKRRRKVVRGKEH
jgi:hypothetical protein